MSKSKFIIDKLAKLLEQGLISYNDLRNEIINILRSKREEIIFKMKITSKKVANAMKYFFNTDVSKRSSEIAE